MDFSLSSSLVGSAVSNPDKLALDLQFAADKTLTARKGPTPAFTRGSSGRFVGSNGLIQSAGNNVARFDHDPVTLACKGLLIEESRTNVALYSGALVIGTGWATDVTPGATSTVSGVGPDGNNAYEIAEIAVNFSHAIINTGGTGGTGATSITSGITYTGSIFLKKVTGSVDWIQLTFAGAGFGTTQYANFNLSTGAIGNSSGGTARVEAHANGWYRVSWTAVATVTTTTASNLIVCGNQNTNGTTRAPSYAGSTANKFLAAMGQFETGAFPTSYIPTTTASVIRSADVCSITGSDFSGFYNPLEGTVVSNALALGFTTSNNMVYGIESGTTGVMRVFNRSAQTNRLSVSLSGAGSTPAANYNTANVVYKSAVAANADGADFVIDGTQIPDVFIGSSLSADNLKFSGISSSTSNNIISSFRYYKKRLPVAKLQAFTV